MATTATEKETGITQQFIDNVRAREDELIVLTEDEYEALGPLQRQFADSTAVMARMNTYHTAVAELIKEWRRKGFIPHAPPDRV